MVGGSSNPNVMDVLLCLSCHDGNTTSKGAMMTGTVYESLPSTYTGSGKTVPTFLGNDGTGSGNYANDHPVGPSAKFSCNAPTAPALYSESGYNWDCEGLTFTLGHSGSYSVKVTPGPNMASFINNYGFFVSLVSTDGANAYGGLHDLPQPARDERGQRQPRSPAAAGTASAGASGLSGQLQDHVLPAWSLQPEQHLQQPDCSILPPVPWWRVERNEWRQRAGHNVLIRLS